MYYRRLLMVYLTQPKPQFWLNVNRTDGLAESDRVAIRVFHSAGLCASLDVMTYDEAAAVVRMPSFYRVEGANDLKWWDWSALTTLGASASLQDTFRQCGWEWDFIPDNLFINATILRATFAYCNNLKINSLPPNFTKTTNDVRACFLNCSSIRGVFNLNSDNFGANCINFDRFLLGTGVTYIVGKFNLQRVNLSSTAANRGFYQFIPNTCTHVEFVPNTLKFSATTKNVNMVNVDNGSLFSLAVCLFDWWNESAGDFVGNEGKTFGVTQLQKNTLDASDYESGYSYTDYISDKGWNLTIQN